MILKTNIFSCPEIREVEKLLGVDGIICKKPTPAEIYLHRLTHMWDGTLDGIEPVYSKTYVRKIYFSKEEKK